MSCLPFFREFFELSAFLCEDSFKSSKFFSVAAIFHQSPLPHPGPTIPTLYMPETFWHATSATFRPSSHAPQLPQTTHLIEDQVWTVMNCQRQILLHLSGPLILILSWIYHLLHWLLDFLPRDQLVHRISRPELLDVGWRSPRPTNDHRN